MCQITITIQQTYIIVRTLSPLQSTGARVMRYVLGHRRFLQIMWSFKLRIGCASFDWKLKVLVRPVKSQKWMESNQQSTLASIIPKTHVIKILRELFCSALFKGYVFGVFNLLIVLKTRAVVYSHFENLPWGGKSFWDWVFWGNFDWGI